MRKGEGKIRGKLFWVLSLSIPLLLLLTLPSALLAQQQQRFKKQLTNDSAARPRFQTISPLKERFDTVAKRLVLDDALMAKLIGDTTNRITVIDSLVLKDFSKDSLDAPIAYSAEDSGVLDIPAKTFYLYGKAKAAYTTMTIEAGVIKLDNAHDLFTAYGITDSAGAAVDRPKMVDRDMTTISDTIAFNTKSKRGISKSTYTQQGEMYVYADRIKKLTDNSFFASKARFTTCNLDTPHFAFRTRKMKVINNKWGFSGLTYPEFEGVPLPIGIPFGIYPLNRGRHSGMLPPTFTATQYFGLGLEGLGYYKVLNQNVDMTLRTNIYSYGGYTINLVPTYRYRYRFNGGLNITYQKSKFNFKGDPDYSDTKTYSFAWFHSMDSKARPGVSFSSNVNISSSKFNRLQANNPIANFTNQLSSSIQYSKQWGNGKYNLQTSAQHSQNNNTATYDISLPNVNFNVNTFYPFKKEERVGAEKWYEKLGISYSTNVINRFSFNDTTDYKTKNNQTLFQHILDTSQWGFTHNIPLTLSLPALGPVTISPGISYQEKWYGELVTQKWDEATKSIQSTTSRGFYTAREVNTSLGFQTALFGTFNVNKGNLVAIRHTIRPTFSLNYKPDLVRKYYDSVRIDSTGRNYVRYSKFSRSPVGGFSEGQFGGMSFGIIQQLQAKVKDKSDTTGKATKKISLIDNFSITSGYNMFADSNKLSDIAIYMGTTLFNKINITASTSLTPYVLNKYGNRTAKFSWQGPDGFSIGSFNNASISINTSLQSKKKDEKKGSTAQNTTEDTYYNPEEDLRQQEYIRNHPAEFTDFNVAWTLSASFSYNLAKIPKADYTGFTTSSQASINLQGDFSLTPKWKLGGNTSINAKNGQLGLLTMFISRDLHCWQMSINVTPIGSYSSFSININPKSSILRDLKVNRTRSFQNVL